MTEYRNPQQYDSIRIDFQHTWRFLVENVVNDNVTSLDLSTFDSVHLHTYAFETSSALITDVTCTVLTATADLERSTQARCQVQWTPADADFNAGTYKARLVGKTGSDLEILEHPWEFTAYAGGPTS